MDPRPFLLALIVSLFLLVGGAFVFFATRVQAQHAFLHIIQANQAEILRRVNHYDGRLDDIQATLAEIKERTARCSR